MADTQTPKEEYTKLTDLSIKSRKIIRYSIYFFIFVLVGRAVLYASISVYRRFFPKPPPPPTVGFNRLPTLPFPPQEDLPSFEYSLQTPTGTLPQFPDRMNVYFMPPYSVSFSSKDDAIRKAKGLGFTGEPIEINATTLRFNHPVSPAVFEVDIVTGAFSVDYSLAADPTALSFPPPSTEQAIQIARDSLKKSLSQKDDLTGPVKYNFIRVEEQNLIETISLSEADFVKVNLFRKAFTDKEYPSLPLKPSEANVWAIVSSSEARERTNLIKAQYRHFPVDEDLVETYPIKTSGQALEELKNGGGYIANFVEGKAGITIRNIYLAYFDPPEATEYYQPMVVFEDEEGFVAYVPAVTPEYYGR